MSDPNAASSPGQNSSTLSQASTEDFFAGWEHYPSQLTTWNPFCNNSPRLLQTLIEQERSLFSNETRVHVIDTRANDRYKAKAIPFSNASEVENHIVNNTADFRIMSISREHSLKPLQISKTTMLKILHSHDIGPSFLDLVFSFRPVEELSEKGHTFWMPLVVSRAMTELCYQFKYVERNDRKQGPPWSERQIGVYHRFGSSTSDVMMLLHAGTNTEVQQRLQTLFSEGQYSQPLSSSPLLLHALIISTHLDNWRWALDYYGNQCQEKENAGFTVNLHHQSLHFTELQALRNLQSKLLVYSTILEANRTLLEALEGVAIHLTAGSPVLGATASLPQRQSINLVPNKSPELQALSTLKLKCEGYIRSIQVLQNRADKLTNLLSDALNLKSQDATITIADSTFELTQQSVDDNAIVRVITVITLIYLPTQGVATFFGMNLTSLPEATNKILFADDWWLFLAVSIPLTLITLGILGIAWLYERSRKLERKNAKLRKSD